MVSTENIALFHVQVLRIGAEVTWVSAVVQVAELAVDVRFSAVFWSKKSYGNIITGSNLIIAPLDTSWAKFFPDSEISRFSRILAGQNLARRRRENFEVLEP